MSTTFDRAATALLVFKGLFGVQGVVRCSGVGCMTMSISSVLASGPDGISEAVVRLKLNRGKFHQDDASSKKQRLALLLVLLE